MSDDREKPRMLAIQRQNLILQTIAKTGFVSVPALAVECAVTEMTMRRDLDRLAEAGKIERTHGGAVAIDTNSAGTGHRVEPHYHRRAGQMVRAKRAIATAAAKLVRPGMTIGLDIGTTALELALELADQDVAIYTSSLRIASALADLAPHVYVPTGLVTGTEPSVVGQQAEAVLGSIYYDIAFIGAAAMSDKGIAYDYSPEDACIKRILIKQSRRAFLLLDSSKTGRSALVEVCRPGEIRALITDRAPDKAIKDALAASGTGIVVG
ncbi:MAG: DeoR/GlpR transcriptional regulator [Rhodobacteraceae bacterium]|nr:DeoR/GlpR transcriptional regulator [Paracoccaceae bacterium]